MTRKSTASDYPKRDPELFYEIVREQLSRQQANIDALDGKISQLFGLSTALLGILAAVFALSVDSLSTPRWIVIGFALAAYVGVAIQSVGAYREREWYVGPSLDQLWRDMKGDDQDALIGWRVANVLWWAHRRNADHVTAKAESLPWIFRGVILQSALVVLALILVAAGQ